MKKTATLMILILILIIVSCATTQHVDYIIEDAAWSAVDALEKNPGKTLAVYYFTSSDENDAELSKYISQGLTTQIANTIAEEELDIKIISRQMLDQIMAEQSFQLSDLVDETTQTEVGKILGADLIMAGQLSWIDDETCHLNAQIIEIETGVVLGGFLYDFWTDL
ncbi:MAG: hypothetical protein JEY99_21670 [Spirochaetales bacterium]|nr:hypothetical protein [Spirochaetales bacterium]